MSKTYNFEQMEKELVLKFARNGEVHEYKGVISDATLFEVEQMAEKAAKITTEAINLKFQKHKLNVFDLVFKEAAKDWSSLFKKKEGDSFKVLVFDDLITKELEDLAKKRKTVSVH